MKTKTDFLVCHVAIDSKKVSQCWRSFSRVSFSSFALMMFEKQQRKMIQMGFSMLGIMQHDDESAWKKISRGWGDLFKYPKKEKLKKRIRIWWATEEDNEEERANKRRKDVKYVCKKGDVESVLALKSFLYLLLIILNRFSWSDRQMMGTMRVREMEGRNNKLDFNYLSFSWKYFGWLCLVLTPFCSQKFIKFIRQISSHYAHGNGQLK